ncbi:MAG: cytochrome C [Ignavibacteriaceae bacterium]|nr:cytochrome C [Ignavibacteriaceae bacterium]
MKMKFYYLSLLLPIAIILMFAAFTSSNSSEQTLLNEEVIKFSHKVHAELTDCKTCHASVLSSTSMSDRLFPNHDNCKDCHDVEDDTQCSTCHFDGKFEPLNQSKSSLIFNHKYHLAEKALECQTCHKGFETITYSSELSNPNPIMEDCYTCHNNKSTASNSCESCHISTVNLIPQNHRSAGFISNHKFAAKNFDANCMMCHDLNENSCQDCHVATTALTETNLENEFYQPYSPSRYIDGAKNQQIVRVHELNYRFIHGMDAKGQTSECQSCHQIESFCGTCHQSKEEDFALGGILPTSHLKSGFSTIGVGSGGGEHAALARRDIENCISCHDVQGADPTCITCHLDSDGIKGTNPKTHPSGFMKSENGDWHEDQGSVCYNCHTSASPQSLPGVGFCSYCHGSK